MGSWAGFEITEAGREALRKAIIDAESEAARTLANGNDAKEKGKPEIAQRWYDRSQTWLDLANDLRGWGDGTG